MDSEQQQEEPVALFCLDGRPQLKLVRVPQTDVSAYQSLMDSAAMDSTASAAPALVGG